MKAQFIISFFGIIVAGLAFLLVAIRAIIRAHKKKPVSLPASIALCIILLTAGAFSGYKFLEASFDLAIKASKKVTALGQELLTSAVNFGTVSIFEGLGETADHFNEKWRQKMLTGVKALEFSVVSCQETRKSGRREIDLVLAIRNTSDKSANFNDMVEHQLILLKDPNGMCYPMSGVTFDNSILPPGLTSVRQIHITLPDKISPTLLVTPAQEVPLHKK
jgi:hypothetical protein